MSASREDNYKKLEQANAAAKKAAAQAPEPEEGSGFRVDGFDQVLQMLRAADADFRESLLRRLAQRDPRLVASLRRDLRDLGL